MMKRLLIFEFRRGLPVGLWKHVNQTPSELSVQALECQSVRLPGVTFLRF